MRKELQSDKHESPSAPLGEGSKPVDAEAVLTRIREIVAAQAEDEGLWFIQTNAAEGYLQQELRRLHSAIETEANKIAGDPCSLPAAAAASVREAAKDAAIEIMHNYFANAAENSELLQRDLIRIMERHFAYPSAELLFMVLR